MLAAHIFHTQLDFNLLVSFGSIVLFRPGFYNLFYYFGHKIGIFSLDQSNICHRISGIDDESPKMDQIVFALNIIITSSWLILKFFKISYRNEGISQWSLLHQCNFCTWFVNLSWFFSFFFSSTSNGIQYEKPFLSGKSHYRPDTIFQFLHGHWSGSWWVDALYSTFHQKKGSLIK